MRKKTALYLLVIFIVAVKIIFGCGCSDSSCTCEVSSCQEPDPKDSKTIYTYYEGQKTPKKYEPLAYPEADYKFTDSDCVEQGTCECSTDGTSCSTDYSCSYPTKTCRQWEDCDDGNCGSDSDSCRCDDTFCKGWCMDNAPAYDDFSGCSDHSSSYENQQSAEKGSEITKCKQLGGTCENKYLAYSKSDKNMIESASVQCPHALCNNQKDNACFIEKEKKCSDYGKDAYCLVDPRPKDSYCGSEKYCDLPSSPDELPKFLRIHASEGFSDCGSSDCCVSADTALDSDDPRLDQKYTLIPDPHEGGGKEKCYCNYLAIRNFYECEDAAIEDSHPCNSNNCAPDFTGGKSFCCPENYCSHDLDIPVLCQKGDKWASCAAGNYETASGDTSKNAACFQDKKEISYEGYLMKCDKGQWKTTQGCGETLFNYALQSEYEYASLSESARKNGFGSTPIMFDLDLKEPKDVFAYIIPKPEAESAKIIAKDNEGKEVTTKDSKSDGSEKFVLKEKTGQYKIFFSGKQTSKVYNLTVDCYTPDNFYCNPGEYSCGPGSYCVEDSPTNTKSTEKKTCQIYEDSNGNQARISNKDNCYYCCPKGQCAHKISNEEIQCYNEGIQKIEDCNWVCKNGIWGKGGINNAPCEKDCDCNFEGEPDYVCSPTATDISKKICCEKGGCAAETSCVQEGDKELIKGSIYVCRGGIWEGAGIRVDSDYSRAVLSEKKNKIEIALSVTKNDINTDEQVSVKAYHFFDKGNYNGNIRIVLVNENGEETRESYNQAVEETIELPLLGEGFENIPVVYKVKITAPDVSGGNYITYIGSSLVVEVIK